MYKTEKFTNNILNHERVYNKTKVDTSCQKV